MQNTLRFLTKNTSFSSLINNFKIRIKSYPSKKKNFSFHQNSEGILHSLFAGTSIRICRYYHQNLLQLMPSDLEGNFSIFFRQSFFPYNLKAFHTTVHSAAACIYGKIFFWTSCLFLKNSGYFMM